MLRSVLMLLMSALLLSVAVGLPLSLEESAEKSWLDLLLEDVWESDELLDSGHENAIHKRSAEDSALCKHLDELITRHSGQHEQLLRESLRDLRKAACPNPFSGADTFGDPMNAGNTIHKRAAKDLSSSSEEHKDKAKNSSGESSSEEQKAATQAPARRRRSELFRKERGIEDPVREYLNREYFHPEARRLVQDTTPRFRRQVSGQEQQRMNKASGELELDAQAEKELDEEMARAVADVKDNGSIEDYAQGCEVMEVSSKEANEATYAE